MYQKLIGIVLCHLIGDYLFQSDYIAQNKGKDWYLLFVHAALYCVPFAIWAGIDLKILVLFGTHFIIDALKARYQKIGLCTDQMLHYAIAMVLYLR